MEQLFVIVSRNLDGEIKIEKETDIIKAIAIQKGMLIGCGPDFAKGLVTKDEIEEVIERLEKYHKDRIYNDYEEVTIVYFPARDKLR